MKRIIKKFNISYTVNDSINGSINMYAFNIDFAKQRLERTLKKTHGDDIKIKLHD